MEIALLVILTVNVIISFTIMNLLSKQFQVYSLEMSPVLETVPCRCAEELIEELKLALVPTILEEPVSIPTPPDDSYHAWTNRVEEPTVAPPSPHGPPPQLEPLQRPYGFSR